MKLPGAQIQRRACVSFDDMTVDVGQRLQVDDLRVEVADSKTMLGNIFMG
jgi:hypothetical protein